MLRESTVALKGNDQFEGFGIELIHELSLMLGFNYTFELQLDNVYGSYNNKTKQWTGMILQLLKEVLCACDFACTYWLRLGHWALSTFLEDEETIT
jgi:hypothetical protein